MTVRITNDYFSGLSHLADNGRSGLAAIVRSLAIDNARNYFKANAASSITDSTGGTAGNMIAADIPIPPSATATSTLGEGTTAFATSIAKTRNAIKVYATSLNAIRAKLGLRYVAYAEGTVASANTLPSQDLTGTGAAVGSTVQYAEAAASLKAIKGNMHALVVLTNDVLIALGQPLITNVISISQTFRTSLPSIPAAGDSSTDGTKSVLVTDMTAFLAATANVLSTMAAAINKFVVTIEPASLTDSTTGTAASALAANVAPVAANGAATTSAPKAGFDTQLALIKNAVASLTSQYNTLALQTGLKVLADNSGGTVSSTLAALSTSLSAVDGSSGTSALDVTTATARMTAVKNALSTLGFYISAMASKFDVDPLGTDALGGTVSTVIAALPATGTGVGGTGQVTMLNTGVNTWLTNNKNNIATLAAKLNAITANATIFPLYAVAG